MIDNFIKLATLFTLILLAVGFLGFVHRAFDTFANFRWHLALALLGLAIITFLLKHRRSAMLLVAISVFGIWQTGEGTSTGEHTLVTKVSQPYYRLLHLNLQFNNPDRERPIALIKQTDADILSLNEISVLWEGALTGLTDMYPYKFHCPEWKQIGGVMILSKFPFTDHPTYCHDYAALGMVKIEIDGKPIGVGSAHLRWPWPASGPRQITALEPYLKTIGPDAIIAGDFNAATWTYSVRRFAEYGNLQIVSGLKGTWIDRPLPIVFAEWLGFPIDHIMSKGVVKIWSAKTLEPVGSDHLPILVEFSIANGQPGL